ncbi:MAG TPA: hypothetical protein VNA57_13835 [Acidimicrobiales bacterium]|nr:hypothetical protein [Acidimicrobiales bacterium]
MTLAVNRQAAPRPDQGRPPPTAGPGGRRYGTVALRSIALYALTMVAVDLVDFGLTGFGARAGIS